jgi:hypothetical protein
MTVGWSRGDLGGGGFGARIVRGAADDARGASQRPMRSSRCPTKSPA